MFSSSLFSLPRRLPMLGVVAALASAHGIAPAVCDVETAYTWSTPQVIGTGGGANPTIVGLEQSIGPRIDTDESGVWVAAWGESSDDGTKAYVARSADNADSWGAPFELQAPGSESSYNPVVATNTNGAWVTTFQAQLGLRQHFISRSIDNAANWSTPVLLVASDSSEVPDTALPLDIENNEASTWLILWSDMQISRSTDNGVTWSPRIPLGVTAEPADIATDASGVWIVAYKSGTALGFVRSADDGATWSSPQTITSPTGLVTLALDTDRQGNWLIVNSGQLYPGTSFKTARSTDNGVNWSVADVIDSPVVSMSLAADHDEGRWISLSHGGTAGSRTVLDRTSFDTGATWTPGRVAADTEEHSLNSAALKTDQNRTWVGVFGTTAPLAIKTVVAVEDADLSIVKSAVPDPATGEQPLDYVLQISNLGDLDATGVTLTDTLPPGVTFVSATPDQGTCGISADTVLCELGTVPCQSGTTVTIRVTPERGGLYENTASVASDRIDLDPGNNTATITTVVNASADLSLVKTASPDPAFVGSPLTYTLAVHNNGPQSGFDVQVVDTLPGGAAFTSAGTTLGSCSQAAGIVTCNLGQMAAGSDATITIVVTPTAVGSLQNTATVQSSVPDPDSGNNISSITTTVNPAADLAVTKTGPPSATPGSTISYTLSVTNNGPSPATAVVLTDVLPSQVTFSNATPSQGTCAEAAGTITCDIGSLASAATATVTVNVTATSVGTATNTASVGGAEFDPDTANNTSSVTTNISTPADLSLDKSGPSSAVVDNAFAYTITVQNSGPNAASEVTVTDGLPAAVSHVSSVPSQGVCVFASGVVTCNLGALPVGGSATVTINVTAAASGTATNTATATAAEPDPNPENNTDSVATEIVPNGPPDLRGTWDFIVTKCRSFPTPTRCRLRGRIVVQNLGIPKRSSGNLVQFFLSNDNVLSSDDLSLGGKRIRSMRPDSFRRLTFTRTLPTGVSPGGKYVIALLDATNAVAENNELNNTVVFGPIDL